MFRLVVVSLLLFWCNIAFCGSIGAVTELTGSAVIIRNKQTTTVTKGTFIEPNDTVTTKNGKVKILFNDDTIVSITESSSLLIDDFVFDPKKQNGKLSATALQGTVRYVSGAIAHSSPTAVKLSTPTSTIAVRGTDFIMSVNEIGSTLVVLMPSCETNLANLTQCSSGVIDVATPAATVTLDKPYQATLVETAALPPSPPIVVNLLNTPLNNNLQLSPPKTLSGVSIVNAARAAAEKTGDIKNQISSEQVASTKSDTVKDQIEAVSLPSNTSNEIPVSDPKTNSHVYKVWKDPSETEQIGWQYESVNDSNSNYVNIKLPLASKALVIVTQDRLPDAVNFNLTGKSQGTIIINQAHD